MTRTQNYSTLARMLLVLFVLAAMVLMQRKADLDFEATAPIQRKLHSDLDADSHTITGPSQIYDVLHMIAQEVLSDSKCGDGVCDMNEYEYPGFGRFGCEDDCGKYSKTSFLSVQLQDFLGNSAKYNEIQGGATWDLSKIKRSLSPGYKWNMFSHTMGAYIFEEHQNVTSNKVVVEVPDGNLELRLFQVIFLASLRLPPHAN